MRLRTVFMTLLIVSSVTLAGCTGTQSGETTTTKSTAQTSAVTQTTVTSTSTAQRNSSVPPAEITISNVSVEQGGSTVLVIHAQNIGELHLNTSNQDGLVFEYENATYAPPATSAVGTYPPYWVWDPVQSTVTIRLPIHATQNSSPGLYRYNAVAWNTTNHTHKDGATTTFRVHIKNTTS